MRRSLILSVLLLVAATLAHAGVASAAPGDPFQFKRSFDVSSLTPELSTVAVNHQTGNLLINERGTIYQLDTEGKPVDFSALGSPKVSVEAFGAGEVVIDNTGGPTQGNFYLFGADSYGYWAFRPDGTLIGAFQPGFEGKSVSVNSCGGGVGPNGNIWFNGQYPPATTELTPAGAPTGREYTLPGEYFPGQCPVVFDSHGGAYLPFGSAAGFDIRFEKFDSEAGFLDLGETGMVVDLNVLRHPAIDPATDDLYVDRADSVLTVPYSNPLVKATPTKAINGISGSNSLAFDASGQTLFVTEGSKIDVFHREPPSPPSGLLPLGIDEIRSRGALVHAQLIANGAATSYRLEYGTDTSYGASTPLKQAPLGYFPAKFDQQIEGLEVGTTYHVRLVATNSAGTTYGPDRAFRTYPTPPGGDDPCANALARKQTGARALPDCRAFELVSAADTGGYDVESNLVAGQVPFPGYPQARDRVLYATHAGAVPGPWHATNKGPDPYLATRGEGGWSTQYVGLPSDLNSQAGGFSSVLGAADSSLGTFAFAGPGLCSPCFGSGLETGIPVRLPSGQLVQGMAGSLDPGVASAKPEGKVAKYLSADGTHLVFASKYGFEPGANSGGNLTVYARDLAAGTTEIVSTAPAGTALTGPGISALDVSTDGSRVVVARKVAEDAAGNEYVHPYLHLDGTPGSVDLAPGASAGVLFGGMSADGSRVFFTTVDSLLAADADASADLYEAGVDDLGGLDLRLVTPTSSNACQPVANTAGPHWNSTGPGASCDAVAIGGGGGVAGATGVVYFLSPEQFEAPAGSANQPNLYRAEPGAAPEFVATLEPDDPLVLDSVRAAASRRSGDFETSADGRYAVFPSALPLTGVDNFGFRSIFRFDAAAAALACASCDLSGTTNPSLGADALLAPNGLSLIEDGRVFFTTKAALVLNDANARKDVYEWSGADGPQLISAGTGPFDSGLLSVSADGTDAFFFTHDTLAAGEDGNGTLTKIYDARVGGGFFKLPPEVPCAASDECHGAGTVAPGPPDIKSSGRTSTDNFPRCRKGQVKRHGRCVKRKTHTKKRHRHPNRKRGSRHA